MRDIELNGFNEPAFNEWRSGKINVAHLQSNYIRAKKICFFCYF